MKKQKKSILWFTADQHFNHANIIKYCNRPFNSVSEMNKALITNWNSVVRKEDRTFVLGDFGFFKTKEEFFNITAGWPQMGLFSFNPSANEFRDYGIVAPEYKMCYFHGMIMLPDGRIYLGETDSNRPYVYKLEPK